MINSKLILALSFITINTLTAAESNFRIPMPIPDDTRTIDEPAEIHVNVFENGYKRQVTDQSIRVFDISRQARILAGNRLEAMNVDAFDEVPNSSWFTNRHHQNPMSRDELKRGPHTHAGPDTSGEWTIWRAKVAGFAPGFFIRDARGESYIIKFDPIGYSELTTSAEVVTTKFFHAAGYHVPENFVTVFRKDRIKVGKKVKYTDSRGVKRFMTEKDLSHIFTLVDLLPDGRIRCHASRFIKGKVLGPWLFNGTRRDDPNDIIPHEHRREVRGIRVIAAWLNHYDTNLGNTFDSYIEEKGRRYIRHYLIDFGSSLGSSVWGPMPATRGKENMIQPTRMLLNILSLGFWVHDWEKYDSVPHPSVGRWESHLFEPHKFKFTYPNLAFANMTDRDAFWAAKIVMSFSNEDIKALVHEGKYSNPEAEAYIARIIMERRDKIGRYYFNRVNPLDKLVLKPGEDIKTALCFEDLAVKRKLTSQDETQYFWTTRTNGELITPRQVVKGQTCLDLPVEKFMDIPAGKEPFIEVEIATVRRDRQVGKPVRAFLKKLDSKLALAGIQR